ncbi:MAG: alpha/beta hydrolase [Acidiferrobacterales bacterium]|nr:alpha/beta hydrolase [Acidiferrobacterales bacterium]
MSNGEFSIEGRGPPLFLIHGIGSARSAWRLLLPVLAQQFTVVTYDLRGHGSSARPDGEFGLDDLVEDLEQIRKMTGIDQAHFAGHSLGGMIGPAYARKYPDRVLSLGLLSTAAGRTEDDRSKVWSVVHEMERKGIGNVLQTMTERWFTARFIEQHPEVVRARLKQVMDTDAEVFLNAFRIYAGTEMLAWLHEIVQPTLILTGENDGGCSPRLNRKIADKIPNSKLVILPDYKHSILLEAGEEVAVHIVRFIQDLNL